MRTTIRFTLVGVSILSLICITGCGSQNVASEAESDPPTQITGLPPDMGDMGQAHSDEGPHGGHIIELGRNHEYHAELVEDDATETVSVYILDSNMNELPITAETILLNLAVAGETTSYELTAVKFKGNDGFNQFESRDSQLLRALEYHSEITGKLRVTIDGVPYIGRIAHTSH